MFFILKNIYLCQKQKNNKKGGRYGLDANAVYEQSAAIG